MPGRNDPDDLLRQIADLERRLRILETAPQAPNTSQRGGAWRVLDADGNPVLIFGEYTDGDGESQFGFNMYDGKIDSVLSVSTGKNGLAYGVDHAGWAIPTQSNISGGTFTTIAECYVRSTQYDCITFNGAIICPVGTTGEIKITDGSYTSNVLAITSSIGNYNCDWIHPYQVGWGDARPGRSSGGIVQLQARRTSGAGTIQVYPPRGLLFCEQGFTLQGTASAASPLTGTA